MYILSTLGEPFAIVENDTDMRIEKAVAEEFILEQVSLLLDEDFKMPDWGESRYIDYTGITDEQELVQGNVLITKLVKY